MWAWCGPAHRRRSSALCPVHRRNLHATHHDKHRNKLCKKTAASFLIFINSTRNAECDHNWPNTIYSFLLLHSTSLLPKTHEMVKTHGMQGLTANWADVMVGPSGTKQPSPCVHSRSKHSKRGLFNQGTHLSTYAHTEWKYHFSCCAPLTPRQNTG